jgi:hypothetical protein
MRKSKKRKLLAWETEHPSYIILNERAQVYTGLIGGYPNFSDDLDEAKPLEGQAKFDTLKRFTRIHLEQIFI